MFWDLIYMINLLDHSLDSSYFIYYSHEQMKNKHQRHAYERLTILPTNLDKLQLIWLHDFFIGYVPFPILLIKDLLFK